MEDCSSLKGRQPRAHKNEGARHLMLTAAAGSEPAQLLPDWDNKVAKTLFGAGGSTPLTCPHRLLSHRADCMATSAVLDTHPQRAPCPVLIRARRERKIACPPRTRQGKTKRENTRQCRSQHPQRQPPQAPAPRPPKHRHVSPRASSAGSAAAAVWCATAPSPSAPNAALPESFAPATPTRSP